MTSGLAWFRSDLRLGDNPAWAAVTSSCDRVTALFVLDPALWGSSGEHRRNQLAAHLGAVDGALRSRGGRLCVRRGDPREVVPAEAEARGAELVTWNGDVTPYAARRDTAVARRLGPRWEVHAGRFVHAPGRVLTGDGRPFRVFTPFYRQWQVTPWEAWPEPGGARMDGDPGEGLPAAGPPLMEPGEEAAEARLEAFLDGVDRYGEERDRPDLDATSRLSADLKFGTISPRTVAGRAEGPGSGPTDLVE